MNQYYIIGWILSLVITGFVAYDLGQDGKELEYKSKVLQAYNEGMKEYEKSKEKIAADLAAAKEKNEALESSLSAARTSLGSRLRHTTSCLPADGSTAGAGVEGAVLVRRDGIEGVADTVQQLSYEGARIARAYEICRNSYESAEKALSKRARIELSEGSQ